jgi:hypothetical protein
MMHAQEVERCVLFSMRDIPCRRGERDGSGCLFITFISDLTEAIYSIKWLGRSKYGICRIRSYGKGFVLTNTFDCRTVITQFQTAVQTREAPRCGSS